MMMDLAIRVNVRYVAPANFLISDVLQLFKSPSWVQFIVRYIIPQLNNSSPTCSAVIKQICKKPPTEQLINCVVCMETKDDDDKEQQQVVELPCRHRFHKNCVIPWLKSHSTCPTCRFQLPTDLNNVYSVHAINTTIILQQSQANLPTSELMKLSASNQTIRAVVNARVRRNSPSLQQPSLPISQLQDSTTSATTTTTTTTAAATTTSTSPYLPPQDGIVFPPFMNTSIVQRLPLNRRRSPRNRTVFGQDHSTPARILDEVSPARNTRTSRQRRRSTSNMSVPTDATISLQDRPSKKSRLSEDQTFPTVSPNTL